MKKSIFCFSMLLIFFLGMGCDSLPEAHFESGGVTFDFKRLSDERFKLPDPDDKSNLLDNKLWRGGEYCNFHGAKILDVNAERKKAMSAIVWESSRGVFTIKKTEQMEKLLGVDTAARTSAGFVNAVKLPNSSGGTYRISFRYRASHKYQKAKRASYVLFYFKKLDRSSGKWVEAKNVATTGGTYYAYILDDTDGNWNIFTKEFSLKAGCEALESIIRIDGVGELEFKDVSIVPADLSKVGEKLELSPHGELGGDFEVSEGQVGAIGFLWKHDPKRPFRKKSELRFTLTLPKGYEFLGSTFGNPKTVKDVSAPDGTRVVSFSLLDSYVLDWTEYNRMTVLVRSIGKCSETGRAKMSVMYEGRKVAEDIEFTLRCSSPISAVAPERYFNGVFPSGTSVYFGDNVADEELAKFFGACGVRWIVTNKGTQFSVDAWRKAGVKRITPELGVSNGYFFGHDKNIPQEDRFQFGPTSEDWRLGHDKSILPYGYCPLAIIEERPYVVTNAMVKKMADRLCIKGVDGGWSNWEPFMFETRGCICEKCKKGFEEWKKSNPDGTVQDYRSKQHAKVVETIDRNVRKMVGGGVGMIPGVSWREGCSAWRRHYANSEVKPVDYAGKMEWMNFWGPYIYWDAQSPYGKTERAPVWNFLLAKDIRQHTDETYPKGQRPNLMAFPHGLEGRSWVTQPEHFAMAFDAYFFNRFQATIGYFFPQGYDARFWRKFADATTRAALCEKFVLDGERLDDKCSLTPVTEFESPVTIDTKYTPRIENASLLQYASYGLQGSRIVAALNFSDYADAFFTLRMDGLDGEYHLVDEKGVMYRPGKFRKTWKGNELSRGVLLYVGAARTRVFFVVKAGEDLPVQATSSITAARMKELYASIRSDLALRLRQGASDDAATEKIVRPKYRFD